MSGMSALNLKRTVARMISYEDYPSVLVCHCGANDIGKIPLANLRELLCKELAAIQQMLPRTLIVWSQLLPRSAWRFSDNVRAMQNSLVRVNSRISTFIIGLGGAYIKYPDLAVVTPELYKDDGVHLTPLGNDLFLNTLQGAIESFIQSHNKYVFPDCYY